MQGIGSRLEIAGEETLRWSINNDDGHAIILHVRDALYVPKVPMCLLCPQQVAHQTSKIRDGFNAGASHGTLAFDGFIRTIPYSTRNNLLIVFTSGKLAALYSPFAHESSSPHTTCDSCEQPSEQCCSSQWHGGERIKDATSTAPCPRLQQGSRQPPSLYWSSRSRRCQASF